MRQIFFLTLAAAIWSGCSEAPAAPKRTADCYVRYLKPEGQLLAETILREQAPGQTDAKSVEAPNGIRYLGSLMRAMDLQGTTTYRAERTDGYAPDHIFTWKDSDGNPYTFKMNLPPITAFSFDPATISRKKPATLTWSGAPLEKGERIAMIWESTDGSRTVPMEILGMPGQNRIEFPAAQLAKLEPGTWSLYLVRKKNIQTELPGATVRCTAEYYTDEIVFTVTD
jgi:hypothetical protein